VGGWEHNVDGPNKKMTPAWLLPSRRWKPNFGFGN
jgi:hypothetical protein